MVKRISISILNLLMCCVLSNAATAGYDIRNQEEFDAYMKKAQAGEAVDISLAKGEYVLKNSVIAKAAFSIHGNGATITYANEKYSPEDAVRRTRDHYICKLKEPIPVFSLFIDENGEILPVSESVQDDIRVNTCEQIEGEYNSKAGAELKIPIARNLSGLANKVFSKAYGYFDCAWKEMDFRITGSDDNYFNVITLQSCNTGNFNYEKKSYKNDIRYVIFNAEPKAGSIYYDDEFIYIPTSCKKVEVISNDAWGKNTPTIDCRSSVSLSGLTFRNFNGISVTSPSDCACSISDCEFINTLSYALRVNKLSGDATVPVLINGCRFVHCSVLCNNVVRLSSKAERRNCFEMRDCEINRYDDNFVGYKNCTGALVVSADAVVDNCRIWNTPRDHVFIDRGSVTVRNCVLYNTEQFNSLRDRNLSSDLGLIYVNHFTNEADKAINNNENIALIENNLLFGACAYGKDARGIFIDDGRGDVTCKNNIVLDCQRYSIDSRDAKSYIKTSSIRNRLENNYLGSPFRLAAGEGVPEKDRPSLSGNILLTDKENIITRVKDNIDASAVPVINGAQAVTMADKVAISAKTKKAIRKSSVYKKNKNKFILK